MQSYSLAFLIGLIDCEKWTMLPDNMLTEQEDRLKWINLKTFLSYTHQALLNHHNYRYFQEIPLLLQKLADVIATSLNLECFQEQGTDATLGGIIEYCRGNGFEVTIRERHLFNLYTTYSKPLWAPLCCGCPSVQLEDPIRIPTKFCIHHSIAECEDAVLSLKPVACELEYENRVLASPVLEKCSRCRGMGLIIAVNEFCPKGCKLCYGCASEIYRYPCFPCPGCGLACVPHKLGQIYQAIQHGPDVFKMLTTRMGVPLDEFPTCKGCGKRYFRHILALFGSIHNVCNMCEDCFAACVSKETSSVPKKTPSCPICKEKFVKREKDLLRQKLQITSSVCSFCFVSHVCQPECAICEYRKTLIERFGLTSCSVCRAPLDRNEPQLDKLKCDYCQNTHPRMFFHQRVFCRFHNICLDCAHTELLAKRGTNICPKCNYYPPETTLLCENCGNEPASFNVHRNESDQCRIGWLCASSSPESPIYCSRCNSFLRDLFIDHQLFKGGSFCKVCSSLRYPLYTCTACQQLSCYYCLRVTEQGVTCPQCESIVGSQEMFIRQVKIVQMRCSLCYDYREQATLQACGHYFHTSCLQGVSSCPLH